MKFNQINGYQDLLEYMNRVGVYTIDRNSPGWIPIWQGEISKIINKIESFYNITYPLKNYPNYEKSINIYFSRSKHIIYVKDYDNNTHEIDTWYI